MDGWNPGGPDELPNVCFAGFLYQLFPTKVTHNPGGTQGDT